MAGNLIEYQESVVVASALVSRADFEAARATGLASIDFVDRWLARVWMAACDQAHEGPVDLVTVSERLLHEKAFDSSDWMARLASLTSEISTTVYAASYARALRRRAQMRRMIEKNYGLLADAASGVADPRELREWAHQVTKDLIDSERLRFRSSHSEMASLDSEEYAYVQPIATGIPSLDAINPGFTPGSLVLIAGRTSTGKTCLMLDLARNAARGGHRVAIISLEMSRRQVVNRIIAGEAAIPTRVVAQRSWNGNGEEVRFAAASWRIAGWRLDLTDTPSIGLTELGALLSGLYPRPEMIILDYLGLMARRHNVIANEAVSELSRGLKVMAHDLNAVFVVGSQLSRQSAYGNRPPELHDLRDSGSLEQDADAVLMLDRFTEEIIPFQSNGWRTEHVTRVEDRSRRMLYWRKMRDGETGQTELRFWPEMTSFAPRIAQDGVSGGGESSDSTTLH